jgi:hypothetical protein
VEKYCIILLFSALGCGDGDRNASSSRKTNDAETWKQRVSDGLNAWKHRNSAKANNGEPGVGAHVSENNETTACRGGDFCQIILGVEVTFEQAGMIPEKLLVKWVESGIAHEIDECSDFSYPQFFARHNKILSFDLAQRGAYAGGKVIDLEIVDRGNCSLENKIIDIPGLTIANFSDKGCFKHTTSVNAKDFQISRENKGKADYNGPRI